MENGIVRYKSNKLKIHTADEGISNCK